MRFHPARLACLLACTLALSALLPAAAAQPTLPDNQIVQRSDGALFLIQGGQKYRVYPFPATDDQINAVPDGPPALALQLATGNASATGSPGAQPSPAAANPAGGVTAGPGGASVTTAAGTTGVPTGGGPSSGLVVGGAPGGSGQPANSGNPGGALKVTGSITGSQTGTTSGTIWKLSVSANVTKGGSPVQNATVSVDFEGNTQTMPNTDANGNSSGEFTVDFRGKSRVGGVINACYQGECADWEQYVR